MFWENSIETSTLSKWNRSPAQVGCMRQVLRAGALGRPREMDWGGRWEGGSGRGTHVNSWLIHVNVRQKPLQYCKVISLQLIKINGKKKRYSYRFFHLEVARVESCESGTMKEEQICTFYNKSQYHRYPVTNTTGGQETQDRCGSRRWGRLSRGHTLEGKQNGTAVGQKRMSWACRKESWQVCLVWVMWLFPTFQNIIEKILK